MHMLKTGITAAVLCAGIAVVSAEQSQLVLKSLYFDFTPSILEQNMKKVANTRSFTAKRCAKPPIVDGLLDDDTWKTISNMSKMRKGKPLTELKISFDDKAIYFAVRCIGIPGVKPKGENRAHDEKTWRDDCVEIWMNPWPGKAMTHQFIINCLGSTLDKRNNVIGYNPKWRSAVTQKGNDWFLEAAIPFKALGLLSPVNRVAFNIGRNGPNMTPRSWGREYGNCASSFLKFEGITKQVATKSTKTTKSSPFVVIQGNSLNCKVDRPFARKGERWIEVNLSLKPSVALSKTKLQATLYKIGDVKPVASSTIVPSRDTCRLYVNLRDKQLTKARLEVKFIEDGIQSSSADILLRCDYAAKIQAGTRIPVNIDFPEGDEGLLNEPVTFGVPFARGELWNVKRLSLVDEKNTPVHFQTEISGLWDRDGAVKWVRFDALVSAGKKYFVVVMKTPSLTTSSKRVKVEKSEDGIILDTGIARYILGKGKSPIREIWSGGKRVATSKGTKGLYVIDQKGRVATADSDDMVFKIESAGPVAASIRFEGFYKTKEGVPLARHITRIECFAGQPTAKITHTLILTSDTNKVWFKDIGWEFAVAPGSDPKAVFNIDYKNAEKTESVPVGKDASAAWMIQDSHYLLAHGKNHFSVDAIFADGKEKRITEGGECGDWAALTGSNGGLMMNCRDAARMHPKEFEIKSDKITLRLFSDRAGEELDFRSATLLKKWDFDNWYKNSTSRSNFKDPLKFKEVLLNYKSNAQGWARTHLLAIAPLPSQNPLATAVAASNSQRQPVYAMAAPRWIYRSNAMGPNYPRDPKRFPDTERLVDDALDYWMDRDSKWGDYGFVDYGSGPHIYYHAGNNYVDMYRYVFNTYTLRANLWLQYARSGNRRLREFTANSTRTSIDAAHAHWDTKTNVKGIHRGQTHATGLLPFYWGVINRLDYSSSTNLNTYIWYYQLTGYRRAKECVEEWSDGVKRYWSPAKARRTSRIIMLTRMLSQAYTVTWDPALKELAFATAKLFEDETGELGLDYSRTHYGASYKTQVDLRGLIDAYHIFDTDNFLNTSLKTSRFWWKKNLGTNGFGYNSPMAIAGNFLYNQTADPIYAQGLAVSVRRNASTYKADGQLPSGVKGAYSTAFTFDIGYALDVLVRSGADKEQQASWLSFMDIRTPASIIIRKPENSSLSFQFKTPSSPLATGGSVKLEAVNPPYSTRFLDLNRMTEAGIGVASFGTIHIDKGSPLCDYRISFSELGNHQFYANANIPMVLHAHDYWYPIPTQKPGIRYYFKIPAKGAGMQIFFEGSSKLFTPNGSAYSDDKPVQGWINLPEGKPGLWSFETKENKLVNSRNIPPFFAFQDPKNYFTPSIAWEKDGSAAPKEKRIPQSVVYVGGAIKTSGNKALNLTGKRAFIIPPGPLKANDGSEFIPQHKGTVEFWIRPNWDSFTMPEGSRKFVSAAIDKPKCYMSLAFKKSAENKDLYAYVTTSGPKGNSTYRQFRKQSLFKRNSWTHVAFVWGQRDGIIEYPTSKLANNMFMVEIFVNGKRGTQKMDSYLKNQTIGGHLKKLMIGYFRKKENIDAFIDELRVSDIQRYRDDFTPPSRTKEFKLDKHTRSLFHFNGNLDGQSSSKLQLKGEISK